MASGIDFYDARSISASNIVSHGYTFVANYIGPSGSRYLSASLASQFSNAGLGIVSIYETIVDYYINGTYNPNSTVTYDPNVTESGYVTNILTYWDGYYQAQRANSYAVSIGQPANSAIYFAVDVGIISSTANVVNYFQGINAGLASVNSQYKVGIYGNGNALNAVDSSLAPYEWWAFGWRGSQYQTPTSYNISQIDNDSFTDGFGVGVDHNQTSGSSFGQWGATAQSPNLDARNDSGFEATLNTASVAQGTNVTMTYRLSNFGPGNNTAGSTTGIYLSTNAVFDSGDTLLTTDAVGALGANVGSTETVSFSTSGITAGNYYIIAVANYNHAVSETTETDNPSNAVALQVTGTPGATFNVSPQSGTEGSTLTFRISIQTPNYALTPDYVIYYNTTNGTATTGGDYTGIASQTAVHFTSSSAQFVDVQVQTLSDNNPGEGSETFNFNVYDYLHNLLRTVQGTILDSQNRAPTVSLPSGANVIASSAGQSFQVSSLFTGSDADNNPLTYFLYDSNTAANSGRWVVNGTIVPAQTVYQITASQLAQTSFVAGAAGTSDDIYVQAYDGYAYSGWNALVHLSVNTPPTVSRPGGASVTASSLGQSFAFSSLFAGNDADGDPLTYYLYDSNTAANSGRWVVNGTIVAAQTIYPVTASQLAQTSFVTGAAGTADDLLVQTYDGRAYSGWNTQVRVNAPAIPNIPPTVSLPSGAYVTASNAGQSFAFASLFTGSDANGDPLTYYLYDSNTAANSGRWVVNGTIVAAQTIYPVTASQLAQTSFVAGAAGTADDILVQVYDGQAYSGWNTQVRLSVNAPPTVSLPSGATVTASTAGQSIAFSTLFAGNDPNGDPLTYYLYDSNAAASSGHWVVNGTIVAAGTIYPVTASELALTNFVAGAANTSDDILVQAFDGRAYSGWNAQVHVNGPANTPPTVSLPSGATVTASTAGQSIAFSTLFAGNDANGDPLTYYLYDSNAAANSGHWVVNGSSVAAGVIYPVTASQLALTSFVVGAAGTADDILVQVYDGRAYSGWNTQVHVNAPANTAPTVGLPSGASVTASSAGQSIAFSTLFSGSDADNDALTYYLYDGSPAANSGHWVVNGAVVASGVIYQVSAAQLAQTSFVTGASGTADELYVQDFDGKAYSGWNAHVQVAVPNNSAPTINLPSGNAVHANAGQSLAAAGLFSGSDVNGDTLSYYVYDSNAAGNSGHFSINGTEVPALTITPVTAAQLAQTTFVAGAAGTTDYLYVEAFDGQVYSPWTEFHVFV